MVESVDLDGHEAVTKPLLLDTLEAEKNAVPGATSELPTNHDDNAEQIEQIELGTLKSVEVPLTDQRFDIESIKSTEAILETTQDQLNQLGEIEGHLIITEAEIKPTLAKFMATTQTGDLDAVKELVESGGIEDVNETFSDGITALHWACINNRLSVVKYLCQNGADPNQLGGDLNATPLHWACRNGLVYIAEYLISEAGADPRLRDVQGYNALHLSIHSLNIMLVLYMILTCCTPRNDKQPPLHIDDPDVANRTSLHWAAYQGDITSVNLLLRFGADVNKVDDALFLPIHWAFMKGYKNVLKTLIEHGSDVSAKNNQGKDCFEIAKDMNIYKMWIKVLKEARRDPKNNWANKAPPSILTPKIGKVITFLSPYVFLPVSFNILDFNKDYPIPRIFAAIFSCVATIYLVQKFIIPSYLIDDRPLAKSPLLSGIFSGTAFWCIVVFLYNIIPKLILLKHIFGIFILASLISIFTYTFFKSMFINPGYVATPADNKVIYNQMMTLIALGKFDIDHFCIHTLVRKPLRSRYSRATKRLVARFDHFCPWIYNEVGVRNHKLFLIFVYTLALAVIYFTVLSFKMFDKEEDGYDSDVEGDLKCWLLNEQLCFGYSKHPFHFNLMVWCWLQFIWIVFLCLGQTFQILKGLTTWEFSTLGRRIQIHNHSTLPLDFARAIGGSTANSGSGSDSLVGATSESMTGNSTPEPQESTTGAMYQRNESDLLFKLLGLDQFYLTFKIVLIQLIEKISSKHGNNSSHLEYTSLRSINIPTDFGFKQNWLDFWFLGEIKWRNLFYLPIQGENNLNGRVVDYYKLYEYPSKNAEVVV
ncbi:palmitoyltransferase akr1 [Scheffersomyces spartinae]|uniref:Palmitoyltransferase n=1 Tax=Scheffersomyces spartinae TaxID=45513 RepID=A0A9P7V4R5_9ASCO|nr:palmitoyltransferase akr1 [Scheffersomyces spartinae]KAG7191283.1 palmitoyltransferase akr1 [Scheffersomyces spartinae]